MTTFDEATFNRILKRIHEGADPFTAAEDEGHRFRDMMDWIVAHRASGGADHHPSIYLARAAACLGRLAQRIDAGLVRTPSVAAVERDTIHAPLAEALTTIYECVFCGLRFRSQSSYQRECGRMWVYGHTHRPFDKMVGQTRLLNVSIGYPTQIPDHAILTQMFGRGLIVEQELRPS